jgi:uncharacterized membrane protein YphA (DoxX/SURF4 family)
MLSVFPGLLYPFVAPLMLRVGVALFFIAVAFLLWRKQGEIAQIELPIIGKNIWWAWVSIAVYIIVSVMLLFGYLTQIAALVGALLGLKHAYWSSRYPLLFPFGKAAGLLIMLICLSLLVSGAGILAQDQFL